MCRHKPDTQKNTHMDGHDWKVNVVEQLIVIFYRHAGREEDHQLLLAVLLEKGEEQEEPLLRWANHIPLKATKTISPPSCVQHLLNA